MWRPIESAPKNGSIIRVKDRGGNDFRCKFWDAEAIAPWNDGSPPAEWYAPGWYQYEADNSEEPALAPVFWFDPKEN